MIGTRPVNLAGAAGLIQNGQGEVLLLRRVGASTWGLVTGLSELGEALEDTLKREALEEAGLRVGAVELLELLSPTELAQVANGDGYQALRKIHPKGTIEGVVDQLHFGGTGAASMHREWHAIRVHHDHDLGALSLLGGTDICAPFWRH